MNASEDVQASAQDEMSVLLLEGMQQGMALKQLKGIDDDMLEGVYAYAHRFYVNGQLDKAEVFFRFLYTYDFYNGEYALGLAAVHHMKKDHAKAIDLYALAYALLDRDERPMFHVGQCHLAMGKASMAKGCFEAVVEKSSDQSLVAKATAYIAAIASGTSSPDNETSP